MNLRVAIIRQVVVRNTIRTTSSAITALNDFQQLQLDDEKLALRGDFNGIKSLISNSNNKMSNSPEVVIAKLQEEMQRNYRLSAHKFILSVLKPLEQKNVYFCDTISSSSFLYVPILIKMCGEVMTDVPMKHRIVILDRLIKSFSNLGIKISLNDVNAMVQVWLENYHSFNAKELLAFVEIRLNIKPDATFFALCAWSIARLGDISTLRWWSREMKFRNIELTGEVELAEILCAEKRKNSALSELISNQVLEKYEGKLLSGLDPNTAILSAAIQGAALCSDLIRLATLLKKGLTYLDKTLANPTVGLPKEKFQFLCLPQETVFEIIWLLAYYNSQNNGKEFVLLTENLLNNVRHCEGFFKLLFCQAERHLAHQLYYTSIAIISDTMRIRRYLQQQSKQKFIRHALAKVGNFLVRNGVPVSKMLEVSKNVVSTFGEKVRFYDELMYSILMHRHSTTQERWDVFRTFIDYLDAKRERIHLILPLLVCSDSVLSRCKILYICSSIGYKKFSELDPIVFDKILIYPLQKKISMKMHLSINETFDEMKNHLKSFGVSESEFWNILYSLYTPYTRNAKKYGWTSLPMRISCLESFRWLRENVELRKKTVCFNKLKNINSTNSSVLKFNSIKVLHLLRNEYRKKQSIPALIEAAYELKRKFPNAVTNRKFNYTSTTACHDLFSALLSNESTLSSANKIDQIIEFLVILIKLDFIYLNFFETITARIVWKILLELGWNAGLETWLKFQSRLQCSNALIQLLHYSVRYFNDQSYVNYVLHKANNFIPSAFAKSIYACVLIRNGRLDEADAFIKNIEPKLDIKYFAAAFRLMNARSIIFKDYTTRFPYEFIKFSFEHATGDFLSWSSFFNQWCYNYCSKNGYGVMALNFYDMFTRKNVFPNLADIKMIYLAVDLFQRNSRRWMSNDESGVLNAQNALPLIKLKFAEINLRVRTVRKKKNCFKQIS